MGGAKLKTFSMLKTAETLINNKLSKLFNIKYEDVYNRRVKNVRNSMYRMYPDEDWSWIPDDVMDSKELFNIKQTRDYLFEHYDSLKFDFFKYNVSAEYDKLKFQKKNRAVNYIGVICCLAVAYFWNICKMTITVTSDFVVQDGQHRVIAMFILGMPIIYSIDDEMTPALVMALNISTTKLTNTDSITTLADGHIKNAERYIESATDFGAIRVEISDDGTKIAGDTAKTGRYNASQFYCCSVVRGKHNDYDNFVKNLYAKPNDYDDEVKYKKRLEVGKKIRKLQ